MLTQTTPKSIPVRTPDGLTIAAHEYDNPDGAEIVFIHGYSQSHLSWMRQVNSDLASEFRMVTYDLRGHGNSDKPPGKAPYHDNKAWADELQAVMDAADLKHPVVVGWSYGGRVVCDYVVTHGAERLAGINFVASFIKSFPEFMGENLKNQAAMASDDLAANIAATREFVRGCFEKQPTAEDFETILSYNMMVPPKVRGNLGGRTFDATGLMSGLEIPVLVTHGDQDRTVRMGTSQLIAETIPGARLSICEGIGHSPFYEDSGRFNAELADFVREANRTQ